MVRINSWTNYDDIQYMLYMIACFACTFVIIFAMFFYMQIVNPFSFDLNGFVCAFVWLLPPILSFVLGIKFLFKMQFEKNRQYMEIDFHKIKKYKMESFKMHIINILDNTLSNLDPAISRKNGVRLEKSPYTGIEWILSDLGINVFMYFPKNRYIPVRIYVYPIDKIESVKVKKAIYKNTLYSLKQFYPN